MNNQYVIFGIGRLALFGVGLSLLSVYASIDSGGERGSVGSFASHSSLGSPFTTSSVTAGGIDLLYPLQTGALPRPPEQPPGGGGGGGGGGGAPSPVAKKGKSGAGGSKKNTATNKKSSAKKDQNYKSRSVSKKKSKKK